MAEEKGLNKPVKLKADLAAFLGAGSLPRTEITKKLWDYIKENKLQTKTKNGKPENASQEKDRSGGAETQGMENSKNNKPKSN